MSGGAVAGTIMTPEVARTLIDGKAKPLGSLGRLEELAVRLAVLQRSASPVVVPAVLVCAGDHGAAAHVSAYPQAVTAAMVRTFLSGRAAISLVARQVGARLVVADAGVAGELPRDAGQLDARAGAGTADWTRGPAMSAAQRDGLLARGGEVAAGLAAEGVTVLALGEMGIGNTASAALLAHKVAGLPLLVGRGAGVDDAGLARKARAVESGAARTPARMEPGTALAEFGGFEIAMLAGAVLGARGTGLLVLVDGLIVTAAVLVAHAMAPEVLDHCVFAHCSAEPGHRAMLDHLGVAPLLELGLRLGEGSGAALAVPLVRAAAGLFGMADLAEVT